MKQAQRFKKGDKVAFNGTIDEAYMDEFKVGGYYIVHNYYTPATSVIHKGKLSINVEDLNGQHMVYMLEDNFDLVVETIDTSGRGLKEGDPLKFVDKFHEFGSDQFNKYEVYTFDTYYNEFHDEINIKVKNSKGKSMLFMDVANFERLEMSPVGENDSQVKSDKLLVSLTVADKDGNETTLKRSKCRHYYITKPKTGQARVTKTELKAYLTQLIEQL